MKVAGWSTDFPVRLVQILDLDLAVGCIQNLNHVVGLSVWEQQEIAHLLAVGGGSRH